MQGIANLVGYKRYGVGYCSMSTGGEVLMNTIDEKIQELEQLYLKQTITVLSPHCPHCRNELGLKTITIWTDDKVNQFRKQILKIILGEIEKLERGSDDYETDCNVHIDDIREILGG